MKFKDRLEAGRLLAERLKKFKDRPVVVYALPRGGVILGAQVAKVLASPLDLLLPRKIGHPLNPEYAIGAVSASGQPVFNQAEVARIDRSWLDAEIKKERSEANRRRQLYLADRKQPLIAGKTAIIVDDGIATGLTMQAAVAEVKARQPAGVVIAVPVIPADTVDLFRHLGCEVVALDTPKHYLGAVGDYYQDFFQVEDQEVIKALSLP